MSNTVEFVKSVIAGHISNIERACITAIDNTYFAATTSHEVEGTGDEVIVATELRITGTTVDIVKSKSIVTKKVLYPDVEEKLKVTVREADALRRFFEDGKFRSSILSELAGDDEESTSECTSEDCDDSEGDTDDDTSGDTDDDTSSTSETSESKGDDDACSIDALDDDSDDDAEPAETAESMPDEVSRVILEVLEELPAVLDGCEITSGDNDEVYVVDKRNDGSQDAIVFTTNIVYDPLEEDIHIKTWRAFDVIYTTTETDRKWERYEWNVATINASPEAYEKLVAYFTDAEVRKIYDFPGL